MSLSPPVSVVIDLARVRQNAIDIAAATGVGVIAVVKADAYGLGAARVVRAIADRVDAFYFFDEREARVVDPASFKGRPSIVLMGESTVAGEYLSRNIRPVVWTADRARALRAARPVLSIDTGQQRFACPAEAARGVADAGQCTEVMTHATRVEQVNEFLHITAGWDVHRHAAGSALLAVPAARLDAVRPGLALYRGALRVSARLIDVRDSNRPAGYTGFRVPRLGVILMGYRSGLRAGPCWLNGRATRVLEVGMQTAFIETAAGDKVGDEVTLLGDGIEEQSLATAWGVSPQEVLVRLTNASTDKKWNA